MVVYLHEALDRKLASAIRLTDADVEAAAIEGAVQRLRPKLMTVAAVLASLIPILFESGIGSDVMKPIAAPHCGRNDYLNYSRSNSDAGFLRAHERTGAAAWRHATRPIGCSRVCGCNPASRSCQGLQSMKVCLSPSTKALENAAFAALTLRSHRAPESSSEPGFIFRLAAEPPPASGPSPPTHLRKV